MNFLKISLAAGLAIAAFSGQAADLNTSCPQVGDKAPLALHKNWLMTGWERHEGDPKFVFSQKFNGYYDLENPRGVFFDNFAPGSSQLFRDASSYGGNWENLQNAARSVRHGLTDANDAIVGDKVASTTLGMVGRIEQLDGNVIAFVGRSQLGWKCAAGTWKIHHELNYAWTVQPDSIAMYLGKTGTSE
jgi:hypothetical protein